MAPRRVGSGIPGPRSWGSPSVEERRARLLVNHVSLVPVLSSVLVVRLVPRPTRVPSRVVGVLPIVVLAVDAEVLSSGPVRSDFAHIRHSRRGGRASGNTGVDLATDSLATHGYDDLLADLHTERAAASSGKTARSYVATWMKLRLVMLGDDLFQCFLLHRRSCSQLAPSSNPVATGTSVAMGRRSKMFIWRTAIHGVK